MQSGVATSVQPVLREPMILQSTVPKKGPDGPSIAGRYSQNTEEKTYLPLVRGFECSLMFKALNNVENGYSENENE